MKKLHLPIPVRDMAISLEFYWTLFGKDPTMASADLAWFDLADPRVHLLLKPREKEETGTHRILWVASEHFVTAERQRLDDWGLVTDEASDIGCYYPHDDAMWIRDPDGNRINLYRREEKPRTLLTPSTYVICMNADGFFYSCAGPSRSQEPQA